MLPSAHAILRAVEESARDRAWAEIEAALQPLEGPDGLVAPCELLLGRALPVMMGNGTVTVSLPTAPDTPVDARAIDRLHLPALPGTVTVNADLCAPGGGSCSRV